MEMSALNLLEFIREKSVLTHFTGSHRMNIENINETRCVCVRSELSVDELWTPKQWIGPALSIPVPRTLVQCLHNAEWSPRFFNDLILSDFRFSLFILATCKQHLGYDICNVMWKICCCCLSSIILHWRVRWTQTPLPVSLLCIHP